MKKLVINIIKILITLLIMPILLIFILAEIIVLSLYNIFYFIKDDIFISYILNEKPSSYANVRKIYFKPLVFFCSKIEMFFWRKFKRKS